MKVRFELKMKDAVIQEKGIDEIIIDWTSDISVKDFTNISHEWLTTQNFLIHRMTGMTRIGESSLTIARKE